MERCRQQGILVNTAGRAGTIRISPPLTVSATECEQFVKAFRNAVAE